MMKTKVSSEKTEFWVSQTDKYSVTLFSQSLPTEIYNVLDPFCWFFCDSSSSCMLKVFSEVLDTYSLYSRLLDTLCVLGTVFVPEATKMNKT